MFFIKELLVSLFLIQYCYGTTFTSYLSFTLRNLISNAFDKAKTYGASVTEKTEDNPVSEILDKFKKGDYSFQAGQYVSVYNPEKSKEESYKVHQVEGYGNCLGITTDAFETVLLECPGKKSEKPGCFDVFTPKSQPKNNTSVPAREQTLECIQIVNENCIGILSGKKWTIILQCLSIDTEYEDYLNQEVGNIFGLTTGISRNGPPPKNE